MQSFSNGQSDHNVRHLRQSSFNSQTNLPDQLQSTISQITSSNRSAGYLPATTYGQPQIQPSQSRSSSGSQSLEFYGPTEPINKNIAANDTSRTSSIPDPDDYYRIYQDPFANPSVVPHHLHQGALRTAGFEEQLYNSQDRNGSLASLQSLGEQGRRPSTTSVGFSRQEIVRPATTGPGLRSRKSSVKNLVAQINATSSEEIPPMPTYSREGNSSRDISPVIPNGTNFTQFIGARNSSNPSTSKQMSKPSNAARESYGLGLSTVGISHKTQAQGSQQRKPLFGELLSSEPASSAAGYGITNARRRSGSEGSPMHSPNPMFPQHEPDLRSSQISSSNRGSGHGFQTLAPTVYSRSVSRPNHRRTNSDFPTPSSKMMEAVAFPPSTSSHSRQKSGSVSRIPVISQRLSGAVEFEQSSPTTRDISALDVQHPSINSRFLGSNLPRVTDQLSPKRRQQKSPSKITSPGRRGKPASVPPRQKSPLLRANIIAPPLKVSPPLRSSRPRLPVSSASTTASRAKMAERFNEMQKLNYEKRARQNKPSKPPELSDIDLKARRLRITQALSRSREGQDLRVDLSSLARRDFSSSRTASPALSDTSRSTGYREVSPQIPAVVVEHAGPYSTSNNENDTPIDAAEQEERFATQSALQAMQGSHPTSHNSHHPATAPSDIDRDYSKRPTPLFTQFLASRRAVDPTSAFTDATVETEGTNIDPEPQTGLTEPQELGQTVLDHIMQMRRRTPVSTFPNSPQSNGDSSDHGDEESVRLILRNTTYLDEEEAISKGYRTDQVVQNSFAPQHKQQQARDSWTSSIHSAQGRDDNDHEIPPLSRPQSQYSNEIQDMEDTTEYAAKSDAYQTHDEAYRSSTNDEAFLSPVDTENYRSTMDSDAYTIVNIVLQQHSSSGIVDQQFVDEVYQRVVDQSPYLEVEGLVNTNRIEELCIQEIQQREEDWRQSTALDNDDEVLIHDSASAGADQRSSVDMKLTLPPAVFRPHQPKSSLGSAQDWADASPSVGHWMQFADTEESSRQDQDGLTTPVNDVLNRDDLTMTPTRRADGERIESSLSKQQNFPTSQNYTENSPIESAEYGVAIISAPLESPPPPPPISKGPAFESTSPGRMSVLHPSGLQSMPNIPHRSASLTARSTTLLSDVRGVAVAAESQTRPEETLSPDQRRLKQRRHVLKELVDTEFTYERDMRVLCDIYKQTAPAALSDEDIRVLFGNIDQIQAFSRDFLVLLKHSARPAYIMERPKKPNKDEGTGGIIPHNSSSSTLASTKAIEQEIPDAHKDSETCIGQAFEASLYDMEQVYNEYIRNRHAANQKLEAVQKLASAREWLKECRDNSSDITNAWNLDALLVKPVQRITKYPLLLKELIDSTAENHSDLMSLKSAFNSMTEVNVRINDVKKHAELVDQVLNRKRGQSDVRIGLSKAFGRRAEKLKQHVGMTEMYEDSEYNDVRISFDNNIVQLIVVGNDCQSYEKGVTHWVNKMCQVAAAAEAWIDVGHSHHPQLESKLRQLAMTIRGVSTMALPDHIEHLHKRVVQPLSKTVDMLTRFRDEPKGLLNKRDKRLIDYAQMRTKKERGEKVDRKMAERMDQWEALNLEAKERMKKLLRATAHLVQSCQGVLIQLQMSWLNMVQQKLSQAMGIQMDRLSIQDIERDWKVDFDFQEGTALGLGICNGSLLLEVTNMASFLTPSSTLNGEESPRQQSVNSTQKRSISLNSEGSHTQGLDQFRASNSTYGHPDYPERQTPFTFPNGRTRAASQTSGKQFKPQDPSHRPGTTAKHTSNSASFSRPVTSPSLQQETFPLPRVSMDTELVFNGHPRNETAPDRPPSSSTFFSAPAGPTQAMPSHLSAGSSVFSSAMPMSDSPAREWHTSGGSDPEPNVLFTAASVYEFNIDRSRREAGFPYLTYVSGEIFDVIGERGELWLAKNQDDPQKQVGWIWNKHFAKLAA